MHSLRPAEISSLLDRFHSCDDGLIRSINIRYLQGPYPQITVVISTMEQQNEENRDWVNLQLQMLEVEEYSFAQESGVTYQVISGGLHISYYEDLFFVNFGDLWDEPNDVQGYRTSRFYAASPALMWDVMPYEE